MTENRIDHSLRSYLVNTWRRLTEPTEAITDLPARRQAQFVAALLVGLVPLGILVAIIPGLVSDTKNIFSDTGFYVAVGAAATSAVAYWMSRTKDHKLAAILVVGTASLATFAAVVTDRHPLQWEAAIYLVIPVLIASILLSMRATVLIALAQMVALLLLPLFAPGANWVDSVLNPLSFNAIVSCLVLLVASHRNLLEKDRQAELEQRIAERTAELAHTNVLLKQQIVERETAEAVLAGERNLLRTLIDNLPDYIFVKDIAGRFIISNIALARAVKAHNVSALVGKTAFDFFPPELAAQFDADDRATLGSGQPLINQQRQTINAAGNRIWVSTTKVPLRDRNGSVIGLVGVSRDISDYLKSDETLQRTREDLEQRVEQRAAELLRANERLREQMAERERVERELQRERDFGLQVMNALGQGLTVSDEERRFVFVNPAFARMLGYDPQSLIGKTPRDLAFPEDFELLDQVRAQRQAGQTTTYEFRLRRADGSAVPVLITGVPRWEDGVVTGAIAVIADLTERLRAETALKETNQLLQALVEGSPLVIGALDREANVRLWNPAAEQLFGWKAEEVIGKPYPIISQDQRSEFDVLFTHVLQGGTLNNLELRRQRRDGTLVDVSLSSAPLRDAQGSIVGSITLFADLTARKQAEAGLRASEEASRQFQEQLKALHEVSTELSRAISVDAVCHRAVELGLSRLGFDRLGIWFFDETSQQAQGAFGTDEYGRIRDERSQQMPISEDQAASEVLSGKQPIYFQEDAALYNDRHEIIGRGWVAMAALRNGERIMGSISADNLLQQQPISRYQTELLALYGSTIGHLCARKQTEAAERDQRLLAEALRDTAAAINSTLELDIILDGMLGQVERVIPYDASTIMLIEDGYATMTRFRGYHERGLAEVISKVRLPVADTPNLRHMVETGLPFVIPDVPAYTGWQPTPGADWIRSNVGAPILIEGQVIGFLSLSSTMTGVFVQADAERLRAFAEQAAIAIRNARLYDAVRHHAAELEQRVAERTAELERERAQLQTILDGMGEGVTGVIFDDNMAVQRRYINPALLSLLGYSADEFDPARVSASPVSEEEKRKLAAAQDEAVIQRGLWRGEMRLLPKNGAPFDAHLTITRVDGSDGDMIGMVTIIRDISQEKALQDQRSRFVAYASHELRTPITNLKTRLYLMRRQPEKLSEHVTVVEQVTERMQTLVEDLLDLSRLEHGIISLRQERLDLQHLINNVLEVQRPEAERNGVALACDLSPAPLVMSADHERMMQVITNLVTNAIHYTPAGGHIRVQAFAEANSRGSYATIQVEDTGIGIAAEHLPHIFQPFYRVGERAGGTGLGLSIAKEIVELHGGTISVESEVGRGSRFTLKFPLQMPHG